MGSNDEGKRVNKYGAFKRRKREENMNTSKDEEVCNTQRKN